jgi:hypothetical protein
MFFRQRALACLKARAVSFGLGNLFRECGRRSLNKEREKEREFL